MKKDLINKVKIYAIITLFIGTCFLPSSIVSSTTNNQSTVITQDIDILGNEGTEYWALLIAVGLYADHPNQNRPLMLEEVDDLHETLIQSEIWTEDHIKVIKGKDGTVTNINSGFKWLDNMEDEDDFSLVFLTTHGAPMGMDLPPFDEKDGTDEMLSSYWSFAYPNQIIYDDQINVRLNRLESQGVCLIVDSCYAGGFNDPPNWIKFGRNIFPRFKKDITMSTEEWIEEFGEELSGQNRVVLMASREDEVSYSGGFAPYLIDGLRGYADSNEDDVVTAEEVFYYSEPRTSYRQHPTIYDGYPGEFPLIYLTDPLKNSKKKQDVTNEDTIVLNENFEKSDENSVIKGFVKDADTDDPIEDAVVYIRGRLEGWEFFENETTTDSNGFYNINVPPCRCRITVYADGYCSDESGSLEIEENEVLWLNFSLYPRPPENSIVCGYITDDDTGDPIVGADIGLFWVGDQNQFYMNETISDQFGYYQMNVAAGEIYLEVKANGYFREDLEDIVIEDYETLWMNFSLIPRPLENSVICGYITDAETGNPINYARVEFEWNDIVRGLRYENESHTDSSGFYSINIAAGEIYMDIRKQGYEFYDPYRHDTEENKILWLNISLEKETIDVDIVKPLRAFYLDNNRLFPYHISRIIGKIDIEVVAYEDWFEPSQVEKVEFYIDGDLRATVTSDPYIWTWNEIKFGKHTIKVIAYDFDGDIDSKEIEVYKFL